MRPVTTGDPVAWSVCLSVSLSRGCAVQKRLNGSMFCLEWRLLGCQGILHLDRVPILLGDGVGVERNVSYFIHYRDTGRGFDAAFAKLLWPFVKNLCENVAVCVHGVINVVAVYFDCNRNFVVTICALRTVDGLRRFTAPTQVLYRFHPLHSIRICTKT